MSFRDVFSKAPFRKRLFDRDVQLVLLIAGLCCALYYLPTGYESRQATWKPSHGEVLEVNNDMVQKFGLVMVGEQQLTVRIAEGPFRGQVHPSSNILVGKKEQDKLFKVGDRVHLNLYVDEVNEEAGERAELFSIRATDYYRLNIQGWLFLAFAAALVALGGRTGMKALLSFVFTALVIWKIMIPGYLNGYDPILTSLASVTVLNGVIIFLIGGYGKKAAVAFIGAQTGTLVCCLLSILLNEPFHLNGAVRSFSETLLYSGFPDLDLNALFVSGIFVACAGAVMDLAMDIAASQEELVAASPGISRFELFAASIRVGRAVMGTMTTTLLLAYSTSLTLMLMTFMGQGVPLETVFNMNYVSAEIMHTLAGSFGLVLVMPLTALVGALVMVRGREKGGVYCG